MSKLTKFILFFTMLIVFSFNYCYGIDLNLTENSTVADNTSNTQTSASQDATNTNQAVNASTNGTNTNSQNLFETSKQNLSTSSTVSSVSTNQNSSTSTITNLINIALIVIGVLLIFFAIAILIRLSKN